MKDAMQKDWPDMFTIVPAGLPSQMGSGLPLIWRGMFSYLL